MKHTIARAALLLGALAVFTGTTLRAEDQPPIKVCVISGDTFGGDLGPPIKYEYQGHTVWLCCKSCIKKFNKEPDKYLKKYEEEVAKAKK